MISFTLNDRLATFDADNDEKLLSLLRRNKLLSAKYGCQKGKCGFCTVLIDDNPAPSCIVPVGILRNSKVVTFEHFAKTNKIYKDIMTGFDMVGIKPCGFCTPSRFFSIYGLLKKKVAPSNNEILNLCDDFICNCVDKVSFRKAIEMAMATHSETEGRANV